MSVKRAVLRGTWWNPWLEVSFPVWETHPYDAGRKLVDWVKSLPGRRFDPETATWEVTGVGRNPDVLFERAGFEVEGLGVGEFASATSLTALVTPCTMLDPDGRHVLVRHRLLGYDETVKLVGPAGVWDKDRRLLRIHVADVLQNGAVRGGVLWDPRAIDAARAVHARTPAVAGLEQVAARLGSAVNADEVRGEVRQAAAVVGHYPQWFGVTPFGYQIPGALGIAAGHTGLFDSPGVGKTFQFLLAAALTGAERTLAICPPVVLTNWKREIIRSGLADEGDVVVVNPRSRKAVDFAGAKAVVVADSMLGARPQLVQQIAEWGPSIIGADEAHRMKGAGSKRSEAVLNLAARCPGARTVAITGTPMSSSPHELVPLLEFTGHLAPVFGGPAAFLERYCRQDRYGKWHPRKQNLPELGRRLAEHVWVRRTKDQVLPDLPEVTADTTLLDIDLAEYTTAHREILDQIRMWASKVRSEMGREPSEAEVEEYSQESIGFVSKLRVAAGKTKIPAAAELLQQHVAETEQNPDGTYARPILAWVHHIDVAKALHEAMPDAPLLMGETAPAERDRLVDEFQAGRVPAMICSITAAGVGITLTRGSDAVFVESDWTPALMSQAVDRQRRIGQKNAIGVRVLVAVGTLDEHVMRRLAEKGQTLAQVFGVGDSSDLGDMAPEEAIGPAEIVKQMVEQVLGERVKSYAA